MAGLNNRHFQRGLPAFLATYRFAGKTHQVVINGQTGKVAGEKPVAWTKVWFAAGALVLPGILLASVAWVMGALRFETGGWFVLGALLFVIGAVIAAVLLHQAARASEA